MCRTIHSRSRLKRAYAKPSKRMQGSGNLGRSPTFQARRPVESLDAFLLQFDADGRHVATPEALRIVSQVEELLDRQVLAEKARAAIERLPDLYREAFVLRDLEELPTTEVAQVLGVEPATVRQRVHRARMMVRGYLSGIAGVAP